jgi:hypothetical protein
MMAKTSQESRIQATGVTAEDAAAAIRVLEVLRQDLEATVAHIISLQSALDGPPGGAADLERMLREQFAK